MSIGSRIKEARERKKIKQVELAGMLDTHPITLSRWERDINTPDGNILKKIAEALGTTSAYLLGETNAPSPMHLATQDKTPDSCSSISVAPTQKESNTIPQGQTENRGTLRYTFQNGEKLELPATPEFTELFEKMVKQRLLNNNTCATTATAN